MDQDSRKVRLRYPSADSFIRDFPMLKEGRVFLRNQKVSLGDHVSIEINAPGLFGGPYIFSGRVSWSNLGSDPEDSQAVEGAWVDVLNGSEETMARLTNDLGQTGEYNQRLKLRAVTPRPPCEDTKTKLYIELLGSSENKGVRKFAVDSLCRLGATARDQVRWLLDNPDSSWYIRRNALLILGNVGSGTEDESRVHQHLCHPHPRVREESVVALFRLQGAKAEKAIIRALDDSALNVVQAAARCIESISTLKKSGFGLKEM